MIDVSLNHTYNWQTYRVELEAVVRKMDPPPIYSIAQDGAKPSPIAFKHETYTAEQTLDMSVLKDEEITDNVSSMLSVRFVNQFREKGVFSASELVKIGYIINGLLKGKFQPLNKVVNPVPSNYFPSPSPDSDFSILSKKLPGIETEVSLPCGHDGDYNYTIPLWNAVQHLNDADQWSREEIADWLDELHDQGVINIEFQVDLDGGEENE